MSPPVVANQVRSKEHTPPSSAKSAQALFIDAGPLNVAIDKVAAHYQVSILYQSETLKGLSHSGVKLSANPQTTLHTLLATSSVTVHQVAPNTFVLKSEVSETTQANPVQPSPLTQPSVDEIIVTGTRQKDRTLFSSLSPVDVVNHPMAVGSVEMIDSLATQLPGYTAFRLPLSDGQIFNRTSGLRGLNSDHTLILVNGKRRHRSAFLETADGQPTDLGHIPMYAVERIEVLRDGASAMYGSDAIAGVINVILNDTRKGSLMTQAGQYYAADGQTYSLNYRNGWESTEQSGGTVTVSAFADSPTSRAEQPADALIFAAAHPELNVPNPVQRWGQPRRQGVQLAFNIEYGFTAREHLYSFGTASHTYGSSDFNWRNPDTNKLFEPSAAFPDFHLSDWFKTGFTPLFGQTEQDFSFTVGLRSDDAGNTLDISSSAGQNTIRYFIDNTVNASLGPNSPTSFKPGALTQQEVSVDIDYLTRLVETVNGPATLATGLTLRQERYTITAGDNASWAVGPAALDGLPAGSNGFPGYTDSQAGTYTQNNGAAYVDVSLPITARLETNVALRYENFSLFSDIVRGKVSARLAASEHIMLRATLSNGFRAPTAGQMHSERTSHGLNADFNGVSTSGRLSPLSPVAQVLSQRPGVTITPLKPERSVNISAGIGLKNAQGATLNLDWYHIALSDRFSTTPVYELTQAEQARLAQPQYQLNYPVDTVNFFQNLFDTRTDGIDLVGHLPIAFCNQTLGLSGALNINRTKVTDDGLSASASQKTLQERSLPRTRAQLSLTWQANKYDIQLTWRYIGSWQDLTEPGGTTFQTFSSMSLFDISTSWYPSPALTFRFGLENLFNRYPERALLQANRGLKYSRNSPYDTDGGFAYLRAEYAF